MTWVSNLDGLQEECIMKLTYMIVVVQKGKLDVQYKPATR